MGFVCGARGDNRSRGADAAGAARVTDLLGARARPHRLERVLLEP